jgi:hypothetical protein
MFLNLKRGKYLLKYKEMLPKTERIRCSQRVKAKERKKDILKDKKKQDFVKIK